MIRSLRWRLQVWHALILFLAVAGFGLVLYLQIRKSRIDEVDAELLSAGRVIEGALRGLPQSLLRPGDEWSAPEGKKGPPRLSPDALPPVEKLPKGSPFSPERLDRLLRLPPGMIDRHAGGDLPFVLIWRSDGSILHSSAKEEVPHPAAQGQEPRPADTVQVRDRGGRREVMILGPERSIILVGRSMAAERAALTGLAWQLGLTGLAVFGIGLLGGWWLSRRAVAAIEAMSDTAASVSAANLSQRIDTADVDREIGRLGEILNAMLDRLEAAFDQQVRFTADASHELRTPLAVILSRTELTLSRPRTSEEYRDAVEVCQRSARRMKGLVEDLLLLARVDAGQLELRRTRVELQRLAREAAQFLEPLAREYDVGVRVTGSEVVTRADPDRMVQVVTNLLTNAIRYNRKGGHVTVHTEQADGAAVLTVADTGIGIPPEDLPRVFDRFYRVNQDRSRESGGGGLGLAIVKSIIEAHGGTITLASQPAQGTTATVRLAAASDHPADPT